MSLVCNSLTAGSTASVMGHVMIYSGKIDFMVFKYNKSVVVIQRGLVGIEHVCYCN